MITQIYEVSTREEARTISEIGVDHIGVLVGDCEFTRELPVEAATKVADGIILQSKFSALFLTADISLVAQWAGQLKPAILHLGAAPELLSPDGVATLKARLPGMLTMRCIPMIGEVSIDIARSYKGICWTAIGRPPDRCSRQHSRPDHQPPHLRMVRPAGLDSRTRTDQDGAHRKDLDRMRRFLEAAKAGCAELTRQ